MVRTTLLVLLVSFGSLLDCGPLFAQVRTWDFDGNGNWNTDANWAGGANPNAENIEARFWDVAPNLNNRIISLTNNRVAGHLNFDSSRNYTLQSNTTDIRTLTLGVDGDTLGTSNLDAAGSGTYTLANTVALSLRDNLSINNTGSGPLTINGTISWANVNPNSARTFDVAGTGTTNLNGAITQGTGSRVVTLNKSGSGTLVLGSNSNNFSGGLNVLGGTVSVNHTGSYTLPATGNSYLGAGSVTIDGSDSVVHLQSTVNLGNARAISINNGGTFRMTPGGSGTINSLGGTVTFGAGGGLFLIDGPAPGQGLNVTTNALATSPAIVRYSSNTIGAGIFQGWTGGQGLQLQGGLSAGATSNVVRMELLNGALVEQTASQTSFNGTLIISGVAGGNAQAASNDTNVGRWTLTGGTTFTYAGGLFFDNTVQFTIFNGPRTVNSNITVLEDAEVGFQGRSTTATATDRLSLGSSRNSIDLTVKDGGMASFDVAWRTDAAINTGGINLNAQTVLEAGGSAQFIYTYTGTGLRDAIQVNGDIRGKGTNASESNVFLNINTANGTGSTPGTVFFSNDVQLIVDPTDTSCSNLNGLRLEGTAARVNTLANDARLSALSGTGGTLTLAYTDVGSRTLTAAANPSSSTPVKLGFEGVGSGFATITVAGDLGNHAGIVAKNNASVTFTAPQSNYSCGLYALTGGTLLLGASNVIGDSTRLTLSGGTFHTNGNSDTLGTLTLTADSTINMGAGSSILNFADSSAVAWTGGSTLFITNWSGSELGGGTDQLYIGTNPSGVTAGQLGQIVFVDPLGFAPGLYGAKILATGEIVPVPEPAAILAGLGLLLLAAWRERRRWWPALALRLGR